MHISFQIHWGYQITYSRRLYHPVYHWDGRLECSNGRILTVARLDYPPNMFTIPFSPHHEMLPGNCWQDSTKRRISGIQVEAEVLPEGAFRLHTASGDFEFNVRELLERKRLVFPVGPKYLTCRVTVTLEGYLWFKGAASPCRSVIPAEQLPLPQRIHAHRPVGVLNTSEPLAFSVEVGERGAGELLREQITLQFTLLAARKGRPEPESSIKGYFPMQLMIDGRQVLTKRQYLRQHDSVIQLLEEVWWKLPPLAPGVHTMAFSHGHPEAELLIHEVGVRRRLLRHLELVVPRWLLCRAPACGRIYAVTEDTVRLELPGGSRLLTLAPGWNEFPFTVDTPQNGCRIRATGSAGQMAEAVVEAVYALEDETPEVLVGFDMTTVPHDSEGEMDWLLDYTAKTGLGNLAVFRAFLWTPEDVDFTDYAVIPDEALARWGKFCRDHRIHVEIATENCYRSRALIDAAGEFMHSAGVHEYPGAVYAFDPAAPWQADDMKEAMEHYLRYLRIKIDDARAHAPRTAFGDAAGGHRYAYLAGVDFIRSETMVPHTMHLCSQARPAAESLGSGEWGVHIAIQHAMTPLEENHLGVYFLSLLQPWVMGANMLYEEDSLFSIFKERRQGWDDALTAGKRELTRAFFRFAKTHPRRGKARRKMAFIEGRYAAPFNGFICGPEQDPHYRVWGLFGNADACWGHGQPEKCRQLLDVWMPGASTHPLRQDFTRRRFFFSGTPFGDFDEVPAEASAAYLGRYQLLLHAGWNTCIKEDYDKWRSCVADGATLLIGLPQFSTQVRREFLRDMSDLALWNDGDLAEFCGVRVLGSCQRQICSKTETTCARPPCADGAERCDHRASHRPAAECTSVLLRSGCVQPVPEYSGVWNGPGRENFPTVQLSALPSDHPEEDAPCRLAQVELVDAEVVAWDAPTGLPLITRKAYGKGWVYLVCAYAYMGHEMLQQTMAQWIARLSAATLEDIAVEEPGREIFWTVHDEGMARRIFLLNTDWTTHGNSKNVTVRVDALSIRIAVRERELTTLLALPGRVLELPMELFGEVMAVNEDHAMLQFHGCGTVRMIEHTADGSRSMDLDFSTSSVRQCRFPLL